jgi:sugar/nucleoside kinase (ribokinase family)
MAKFDLVTVGSCGIDIFLNIHEANKSLKFNKSSQELSLRSGDKIMLDGYKFSLGHNAANVSVGTSRLGFKTTIFAEVGSDDFSKRIIEQLESEKIDIKNLVYENGDSNFSVIINFVKERTVFTENIKRDHSFSFKNTSADFLYLTSLSRNWINAYLETMSFVSNKNIPFAFNPGSIQIEDKDKVIFEIIKKSKILFLNKQEAETLLSKKKSFMQVGEKGYIKNLLMEFKKAGGEIIVITDGANGSYCLDERGKFFYLNGYTTNIIEKTGAGDAYASGFIYAFLQKKETAEAMVFGAINAASTMEKVGAQEGLLTHAILEEKVKQLENLKPVII